MLLPLRSTGGWSGFIGRLAALGLGSGLAGLLVRSVWRSSGRLGRSSLPARLCEKVGSDWGIGSAARQDRALALVRLAFTPAFDRHREIDAGDLFIIAKLGLVGLLGSANLAGLVDLDLQICIGIEPVDELVAVLLRHLQLVGERAVEIVSAQVRHLAPVGA